MVSYTSSNFHFFKSFFRAFGDRIKYTNYNWYPCYPHVSQFLQFSGKIQVFLAFFKTMVRRNGKIHSLTSSFSFLLINARSGLLARIVYPKNKFILLLLECRVFANGLGDLGSISGRVIPKTLKMVLDTSLLNTQQYKVSIKGKVKQSRERSSALPYTSV